MPFEDLSKRTGIEESDIVAAFDRMTSRLSREDVVKKIEACEEEALFGNIPPGVIDMMISEIERFEEDKTVRYESPDGLRIVLFCLSGEVFLELVSDDFVSFSVGGTVVHLWKMEGPEGWRVSSMASVWVICYAEKTDEKWDVSCSVELNED